MKGGTKSISELICALKAYDLSKPGLFCVQLDVKHDFSFLCSAALIRMVKLKI